MSWLDRSDQTPAEDRPRRERPPKPRHDDLDDGGAPVLARPLRPRPSRSGGAEAKPPADDIKDLDLIGAETR